MKNLKFTKTPNTKCYLCSTPYYEKPSRLSRTKFCSKICLYKSPFRIGVKKIFNWSVKTLLKKSLFASTRIGDKSPNWKGGTSRIYKTGYYSVEYKFWRKSVFERDNYTCKDCGITGDKNYLTAHHIKSFAHYPELRFDIDNGKTLCEPCHSKTDNYKGRNKKLKTRGI